jgi:hypothetical protein
MYHQFNIQQFYILPTQCIYVLCVDLRTNSYYFPNSINLLVFITEAESVCCAVQTGCLNQTDTVLSLKGLGISTLGISWFVNISVNILVYFLCLRFRTLYIGLFLPQSVGQVAQSV